MGTNTKQEIQALRQKNSAISDLYDDSITQRKIVNHEVEELREKISKEDSERLARLKMTIDGAAHPTFNWARALAESRNDKAGLRVMEADRAQLLEVTDEEIKLLVAGGQAVKERFGKVVGQAYLELTNERVEEFRTAYVNLWQFFQGAVPAIWNGQQFSNHWGFHNWIFQSGIIDEKELLDPNLKKKAEAVFTKRFGIEPTLEVKGQSQWR